MEKVYNTLKKARDQETDRLKLYCLNYMLKNYKTDEDLKVFIGDLLNHGCSSGMIPELISYTDTNKFYNDYEQEIEDLIQNNMYMLGIKTRPLFIESLNGSAENIRQEKNLLSWFAFEETIRSLNEEFKINEDFI